MAKIQKLIVVWATAFIGLTLGSLTVTKKLDDSVITSPVT